MRSSSIGFFFMNLFNSAKNEHLDWQQARQNEVMALRRSRALKRQSLQADLKKQQVRLKHEIDQLKQSHSASLAMLQAQCDQDIRDYQQYLESIDQLKTLIQTSFSHLPDAVALTIHHHAKQILNQMWDCDDIQQKLKHEATLIRLMTAVHQDTLRPSPATPESASGQLPERTLELITRTST